MGEQRATDEGSGGPTHRATAAWLRHPESVRPTVLILGGFLTAPPLYRPLIRRLEARGAAGVVVAGVWTPDWMLAAVRGSGPIATRSARALLAAVRISREASSGAPILLIGHSAGGITGRLLTATEPFPGRRFGAAPQIGAIVTLGTPHRLSGQQGIGRRLQEVASSIADTLVPGAFFAPEIGYVSVASRAIRADPAGNGRQRIAGLLYRSVIGSAATPGTEGDGLIPVIATELDGARQVVLDGSIHGQGGGAPWYGSDSAVDVWWPVALEAWRSALLSRAAAAKAGSDSARPRRSVPGAERGSLPGADSRGAERSQQDRTTRTV